KTSVLGKPVLQPLRNQSVVRQPNAFKHERPQISKQRFASQVDVNHNLSKSVTQHYLPKKSESAFVKPDHMIASSLSRNSSKNMPRFSSNDMVHNHYLEEAKKKTQERDRNSKPSVMTPARFQSTTADSKPKPRSTNHSSGNQPSSDPAPECQTKASELSSDPAPELTTSKELDLLFSLMFDELLNGSSKVVSKSSTISAADAPNQRQQYTTPLNIHTTHVPTCKIPILAPTVISSENINQEEMYAENDQVADDEFINIFSTPVQDQGETSSHHPLEQVIGNPSQPVRTRHQIESDAEMCMFALTVSRTEPKNIKEDMADSAWIESMQEELYQFDRLDVWELVDRPLCSNVINLKWLWKKNTMKRILLFETNLV
nr:Gag-Pol polyprotein [Tanacetum cinerariifolium]